MIPQIAEQIAGIASAAFGITTLLIGSAIQGLLYKEAEFAEQNNNKVFSESLESTRSYLLAGTANEGNTGVLVGFLVTFILLGCVFAVPPISKYSYAGLVAEAALVGISLVWFIVSLNACAYARSNVQCANQNQFTANDVFEMPGVW